MPDRVNILLHHADTQAEKRSSMIWGLRDAWREMDVDVSITRDVAALDPSELIIPHLDLTVTPPPYRKALEQLPHVVNRGVYDISKRRVSDQLLARGEAWDGAVIVKTDANFGGEPERRLGLRRRFAPRTKRYRVYDHLRDVPRRVFRNRALVVERFLPERDGDLYVLRWYLFFGSRFRSMRVTSRDPIVKMTGLIDKQFGLPVPAEVTALRRAWNLDFGKIDFVLHDGKPVILDVNRTPADLPDPADRLRACRPYAPAIHALLAGDQEPDVDVDSASRA